MVVVMVGGGVARRVSVGRGRGVGVGRRRGVGGGAGGGAGAAHPVGRRQRRCLADHGHAPVVELPKYFSLEEVRFACENHQR